LAKAAQRWLVAWMGAGIKGRGEGGFFTNYGVNGTGCMGISTTF
jgi:hypothetical protein